MSYRPVLRAGGAQVREPKDARGTWCGSEPASRRKRYGSRFEVMDGPTGSQSKEGHRQPAVGGFTTVASLPRPSHSRVESGHVSCRVVVIQRWCCSRTPSI